MNALAIITTVNGTMKMSSLDMVDYINSQRKPQESELRHDHFMSKVAEVLGPVAEKLKGTYINPQNNQTYACYYFPKREACLMAMSYSYELQAQIFDRWVELETRAVNPVDALGEYQIALKHADIFAKIRAHCITCNMPEKMATEYAMSRTREILVAAKRAYKEIVEDREHAAKMTRKREAMMLKIETAKLAKQTMLEYKDQ